VLISFALAGQLIFKMFGITLPAFEIAGGLILLLIGIDMLQAKRSPTQESSGETLEAAQKEDASGWAEELAERAAWDGTVADGLPLDPPLASGRRRPAAAPRSKKKLPTKTVGGKQRPR